MNIQLKECRIGERQQRKFPVQDLKGVTPDFETFRCVMIRGIGREGLKKERSPVREETSCDNWMRQEDIFEMERTAEKCGQIKRYA